jgi:hypothetical protein
MTATMTTVAQVEYFWPGYTPEQAIDLFNDTPLETVTIRAGVDDLLDSPGSTTGDLYHWMLINSLRVFATHRVSSRRRGRWEACYRVTIAR